jgi:leucyl aminopeptidase (aminopeptidase T)
MSPEESAPTALARRMVREVLKVRSGENVLVQTWNHTLSYGAACVVEARALGAHPFLQLHDEAAFFRNLDGTPKTLGARRTGAHELAALERSDACIIFDGPADRRRFSGMSPTVRSALADVDAKWLRAAVRAGVRVLRCPLGRASEPQAAFWRVSATTWRGQILRAALEPDLAAVRTDAHRLRAVLASGRTLRVTASNGTDFSVRLRPQPPYVEDGTIVPGEAATGTCPPGRVVALTDDRSASGILVGNRVSYLPSGRADGGQWEALDGRLTSAWFTEGHTEFTERFERAAKDKDLVSSVAVGLNPALAPSTPEVEDHEGGAVTIAVGGNTGFGGRNRCPFSAWIVVGEATLTLDGEPVLDRGKVL